MKPCAYSMFETPLGWCAIAWRQCGNQMAVTFLKLPEATAEQTESMMAQSSRGRPASAPPEIAAVMRRVCNHFQGEVQDFRDVAVDLEGIAPFARRVYAAAREIPPGETRTYGELAQTLHCPGAARAVGQALGRNPIALIIPCHRVLAAGRRPGGFSAFGGRATKATLLALEGTGFGGVHGQLSLISSQAEEKSPSQSSRVDAGRPE